MTSVFPLKQSLYNVRPGRAERAAAPIPCPVYTLRCRAYFALGKANRGCSEALELRLFTRARSLRAVSDYVRRLDSGLWGFQAGASARKIPSWNGVRKGVRCPDFLRQVPLSRSMQAGRFHRSRSAGRGSGRAPGCAVWGVRWRCGFKERDSGGRSFFRQEFKGGRPPDMAARKGGKCAPIRCEERMKQGGCDGGTDVLRA